jgi:tripartite ATP-independent transporter DctP family solute receptor
MKKCLLITMLLAFALVISGNDDAIGAEKIRWRSANVTQVNHPMNKGCEFFIKKIQAKSEGRITIRNYPARQLGDDRELFEQVQQGALDMALVSVAPVGSTSNLAAAFQIPFLFEDFDHWLKVMQSKETADLLDGFAVNNVKALALYDSGFRHAVTVNKEIHMPADFQGLKFRVAETPMHIAIFKALGAAPTPIPYGEIYSSLQNKVIDGLEMDLPAIVMEKHFEVVKFLTLTKHFTWPGIFVVNLKKWNSLSPEDQKLFKECAMEAMVDNVNYIKELESRSLAEITSKGMTVFDLKPEERAAMIEATKAVAEDYMAKDQRITNFVNYARSSK